MELQLDDIPWPELPKATFRYMVVDGHYYCIDDEAEMKEFLQKYDFGPPN